MNPRQKVLFSQLQLAGLGIAIALVAWISDTDIFYYVGAAIFLFGFIRFILLKWLTDQNPMEDVQTGEPASLDAYLVSEEKPAADAPSLDASSETMTDGAADPQKKTQADANGSACKQD